MSEVSTDKMHAGIWPRLIEWILTQDHSTKLLVFICAGIWIGIPTAHTWWKDDIQKVSADQKESLDRVIDSWNKNHDKMLQTFERVQDKQHDLLERVMSRHAGVAADGN